MFGTILRSPLAAIVAALACIAAAVVLWFASHRTPPAAAENASGAAPAIALARAKAGTVAETIVTQGRVGPPAGSDAKLAFALAGIVETVDVRVGDRVTAGQMLASIDRRGLASALAQAQADAAGAAATFANGAGPDAAIASASAKVDVAVAHRATLRSRGEAALSDRIAAVSAARQAELKVEGDRRALERETALLAGGVAAQKDVDGARAQLDADLADKQSADAKVAAAGQGFDAALRQADADVAQARSDLAAARAARGTTASQRDSAAAKVAGAERDYANGALRAPSDGVVVAILKHPGEAVDPTTPAIDVAPPQGHEITVAVPGDAARRVRVGDPALLRITGTRATADGAVVAVVPAVDPTTQATTVVVRGLPSDAVAGQAVTATIVTGHASGIVVPASAVVTDPQTGKTVVFVHDPHAKDTPFASRDIDIASNDGTSVVVRGGLKAGEDVAATGAYDLLAPSGS